MTCILLNPETNFGLTSETIRDELAKENIESRPIWKPMHQQPIFIASRSYLNGVSDNLFANGLCLPSGSQLSDVDFNRIFECLDIIFEKYIKK